MPIKEKETYMPRDNTRTPFVPGKGYTVDRDVRPRDVDLDSGITGYLPAVGDILQAGQVIRDLNNKKYGKAALGAGLLLLPNVAEKPIKQLLKNGAERILRRSPGMILDFYNRHFPYQGTNFMYHGVEMDDLAGVLEGETRAMSPSFAINRVGDLNDVNRRPFKYGEATFLGDKSLLDDSILYYGDGDTPIVRQVLFDTDELVPSDKREEIAERLWQQTRKERIERGKRLIQPSDLRFVDIPKDDRYFEAVVHGTVPLERMKHVLFSVPENTMNPKQSEKIIQAFADKGIPMSFYDGTKSRHRGYDDWAEKMLDILNDNQDILFNGGGHIQKDDRVAVLVKRINETGKADFVRRLLDEKRKVLKNEDGTVSTHELGYVTEGDKAVVFPSVQTAGDSLVRYPFPQSYDRAVERGDTVQMSVPDAEIFTKGYKAYYPGFNQYPTGGRFFLASEPSGNVPGTLLRVPTMSDIAAPVIESSPVPSAIPTERVTPMVEESAVPYRQEGNPAAPILIPGMVPVDPFDMSGVTPSLDLAEMKMRQRYAESGFRDNLTSKAGAKGRYQIMPITLQEYTERTGKTGDLMDASFNEGIRDWYMDTRLPQFSVMKRGNPTDLVREYRRYAAYNMGPGALNKALTKAEKDGVDIDNTTDWVSYLPKETRDYVSFIVGGQDVADSSKTRLLYEAAKRLRGVKMADGGKIHIAKNKRGTFTAAAKKHGKSVQAFASQVLAHKENYSPAMVKKANFARNFGRKHENGGYLLGRIYDLSEEQVQELIKQGYGVERV